MDTKFRNLLLVLAIFAIAEAANLWWWRSGVIAVTVFIIALVAMMIILFWEVIVEFWVSRKRVKKISATTRPAHTTWDSDDDDPDSTGTRSPRSVTPVISGGRFVGDDSTGAKVHEL